MFTSLNGKLLKNEPKKRFRKNLFKNGEIIRLLETMYRVIKNEEKMF